MRKDFRNRVAHDYMNLDIFIVFSIIKNKLPKIKESLEDIMIVELNGDNFSLEEYEACIGKVKLEFLKAEVGAISTSFL
ncbi:MAG: HepT-like ribonuclease domain-containing protein [Fusobacteriaceae bacterium]